MQIYIGDVTPHVANKVLATPTTTARKGDSVGAAVARMSREADRLFAESHRLSAAGRRTTTPGGGHPGTSREASGDVPSVFRAAMARAGQAHTIRQALQGAADRCRVVSEAFTPDTAEDMAIAFDEAVARAAINYYERNAR